MLRVAQNSPAVTNIISSEKRDAKIIFETVLSGVHCCPIHNSCILSECTFHSLVRHFSLDMSPVNSMLLDNSVRKTKENDVLVFELLTI